MSEPMFALLAVLFGAAVGAALAVVSIICNCELMSQETWQAHMQETRAKTAALHNAVAENARLRVALAAGEMTEERKKVAMMTIAALDVVIVDTKESDED